MIVTDTNVVSEFMRLETDPRVLRWAEGIPPGELAISVVTVQEIEYGILRLPDGRRKDRLRTVWDGLLGQFASSILDYDRDAAACAASVLARAGRQGRRMSLADAQIAGTCLAHDALLATRNVKDFAHDDRLRLVAPFTA